MNPRREAGSSKVGTKSADSALLKLSKLPSGLRQKKGRSERYEMYVTAYCPDTYYYVRTGMAAE